MVSLSYKTIWKRIEIVVTNIEFWQKKHTFSIPDSDEADNILRLLKWVLETISKKWWAT